MGKHLLGRDGILLTEWDKVIFDSRMADLVKRHFKLGMTEERELQEALWDSERKGVLISEGPGVT